MGYTRAQRNDILRDCVQDPEDCYGRSTGVRSTSEGDCEGGTLVAGVTVRVECS